MVLDSRLHALEPGRPDLSVRLFFLMFTLDLESSFPVNSTDLILDSKLSRDPKLDFDPKLDLDSTIDLDLERLLVLETLVRDLSVLRYKGQGKAWV
jgi:hypothetical protein